MLDHSGRPASRTARVFVSTIALAGAAYLTYLAVSYIHSGCSCSRRRRRDGRRYRPRDATHRRRHRAYVLSAALAFLIVRNRVR